MTRLAVAVLLLAACGDDGGGATSDAATTGGDATTAKVIAFATCPAFVDATIMDSPSAFVPVNTTVGVDGIVKFVMTADHFVIPNTLTTTDPLLMVSRGQTKCFQFKATGSYGVVCGAHGFAGTITVQ